ncbi:hypothetical protein AG0111_0g9391 [Alternaria gaisen]|uniref:Uncharacterized protein n=1 Tax=Alternaria gaisen TaxID=167740 RepID=A0ACB6FF60_9PLEO|nr:hypothetical protein AG0111_0g9391 [Alternaria gaisen]
MPSFRLSPRVLHRALQSRTYATAQAPAINVTNVPAPLWKHTYTFSESTCGVMRYRGNCSRI